MDRKTHEQYAINAQALAVEARRRRNLELDGVKGTTAAAQVLPAMA